ncbi:MAG: DUF2254 domain-containing protein [Myxococcales bacterium]|nr:DUF2254 domain-containing protein [Myxococcales bacterium]MDD9967315.1 DUF2254 domain-containing protein [Myxococcales bacterium]
MAASSSAPSARIWLLPLSVLTGVCVTVFVLTYMVDASRTDDPARVLSLIFHPNPEAAASTLANAGEIVAAVLAIALTVVAIIVELASNRYTHRVTELFVSEPVNFLVMGLFVVTALQGVWVNMTFDNPGAVGGFVPYMGIGVSMALLTACLLVLLPYFNFVFAYLNPIQIVHRIRAHTLAAIVDQKDPGAAQREAIRGVEQLADVALNAMEHRDKGVSMASINALCSLVRDYQRAREELPEAWFEIGEDLAANPDFVSMDPMTLSKLTSEQVWFEMKVLRQYQMVYSEALHRIRDMNYVIAINTRKLAEAAAAANNRPLLHVLIKFFNTYLRAAINAKDVRTAYNVFNQYRRLAESLLDLNDGFYAGEIARYFKHYGLISFNARLPFILETVAYDMCGLCELAADRGAPVLDELLRIFLRVDKESEGEVQEASLRGVRKAQVKLATQFLFTGDERRARRIYDDMVDEDPSRLASIRDELHAVRSAEYWEITDRGANFDYLPPERKACLDVFFGWFPELPPDRASFVSQLPEAPGTPGAE